MIAPVPGILAGIMYRLIGQPRRNILSRISTANKANISKKASVKKRSSQAQWRCTLA
jgi:hypothetical protein